MKAESDNRSMMTSQHDPTYLPEGSECDIPRGCLADNATMGFLLIDKPQGITSHSVISRLRRACGIKKVGHAGTLDPMATGLLLVAVGKATRLLTYLVGTDKSYCARVRFGASTISDDKETEILDFLGANIESINAATIDAALQQFRGVIEQIPSSVSAKRIAGRRAYDLVRDGHDVALQPHTVTISELHRITKPRSVDNFVDVDIDVSCSSGTYIRALARDLGYALNNRAHLTALRRYRIGNHSVDDAQTLADIAAQANAGIELIPAADVLSSVMPISKVSEKGREELGYGRALRAEIVEQDSFVDDGELTGLIDSSGALLAIAKVKGDLYQPKVVLL